MHQVGHGVGESLRAKNMGKRSLLTVSGICENNDVVCGEDDETDNDEVALQSAKTTSSL